MAFPLSGTRRLEGGLGFTRYSYHAEEETYYLDNLGRPYEYERRKVSSYDPLNFASASLAFVGDNSYSAFTSPVRGERFRVEARTSYGTVNFHTLTLDYRRYFNNGGPVTLATRGLHLGRYGDLGQVEDRIQPLFLGWETFIRGYSPYSFDFAVECGDISIDNSCFVHDRLSGQRIGVLNAEVRLPITGIEEFGLINFPYLPIELAVFADVGMAWDDNRPLNLKWSRTDTDRIPVASTGVSLRFNILGAMILEFYRAYPWQRPDAGWINGFHISPGW